jgi:hypothetical protein
MKRLLNIGLFLSFLIGYLEWGKENHTFIFQAEYELFSKILESPFTFLHPFILVPFCGQVLLLYIIIKDNSNKRITLIALASLGIFMLFLMFIGVLSQNFKIILSTLPFLIMATIIIRNNRKRTFIN